MLADDLNKLLSLKEGWDGFDALPITDRSYRNAITAIDLIPKESQKCFNVFPNTNGIDNDKNKLHRRSLFSPERFKNAYIKFNPIWHSQSVTTFVPYKLGISYHNAVRTLYTLPPSLKRNSYIIEDFNGICTVISKKAPLFSITFHGTGYRYFAVGVRENGIYGEYVYSEKGLQSLIDKIVEIQKPAYIDKLIYYGILPQ